MYGPNCWEWIVAYYAIAKTGAVVNPISSMLTAEEVRYVVKDSGARVLLTSAEKGLPLLDLVGTEDLSHVVLWGDDVPAVPPPSRSGSTEADSDFAPVLRGPAELAAICYTSGTTGHPKGAMQSNRSVLAAGVGTVLMGARGPDDRVHQLPAAGARLRIVRAQRSDVGRVDPDHGAPLRRRWRCSPRSRRIGQP